MMSLLILFVSFCSFGPLFALSRYFKKICRKGKLAKDKPLDKQTLDDTPCALPLLTREFSTASIANYASRMVFVYVSCDLHLQTVHNLSFAFFCFTSEKIETSQSARTADTTKPAHTFHHFLFHSMISMFYPILSISFFGFGSSRKMDMFGQFGLSYVPFIPFPWPCKGPPPW